MCSLFLKQKKVTTTTLIDAKTSILNYVDKYFCVFVYICDFFAALVDFPFPSICVYPLLISFLKNTI